MRIKKFFLIILLILILSGGIFKIYQVLASSGGGFQTFLQVFDLLKTQYVKKDLDETKLFYGAIRGLLYSLNDPYSRFLEPKSFAEMKIRMKGSFGGIGIQIGMKKEILTVIAPLENTPAWRAGILTLDQILAIDDEPTMDLSIEEAVQKIRGPKGTKVKLKIMRAAFKQPKDFEITRDIINIEDLKYTLLPGEIGYIRLISFESEKTFKKILEALADLKKQNVKSLIIDLRNNGGGLLNNAIEISSLFLEKGRPVVATIDRNGQKETFTSDGSFIGKYPLVVLINQASASASEIVAGAIQDNQDGTIIGEKSFGKASVQTIRPLLDGSALLMTVAKYLTPKGRDITEKGIEPDILVKLPETIPEEEKFAFPAWPPNLEKDLVLKKAVEVLTRLP